MKKIQTLFERRYENHRVVEVLPNVTPGMEWVLELVPGVKSQGKEIASKDATKCPYRGMEMEVEGDA